MISPLEVCGDRCCVHSTAGMGTFFNTAAMPTGWTLTSRGECWRVGRSLDGISALCHMRDIGCAICAPISEEPMRHLGSYLVTLSAARRPNRSADWALSCVRNEQLGSIGHMPEQTQRQITG